jgi:hypothetical protein
MKITRLIASVATLGLLGLSPVVLTAPPAGAAVTYSTTAAIELSDPKIEYGERYFSVSGSVTATDPATGETRSAAYGTAALQVSTAKNPSWTTVATDDYAGSLYFSGVKPDSNAQYKIVYSGGTSPTGDVYNPTESPVAVVAVSRKLKVVDKTGVRVTLKLTVKPDFKRKKVTVKIAHRKAFKVKTDARGKVTFKLPQLATGTKVTLKVPRDKFFAAAKFAGQII